MRKKILLLSCTLVSLTMMYGQGQIGINTVTPAATLEIKPSSAESTITPEGFIAPNLTRAQLISKSASYATGQRGALVYVTDISGNPTAKEVNVTAPGYYYFDGTAWQPTGGKISWQVQGTAIPTPATDNRQNIYQMGNVAIGANNAGNNKLYVEGSASIANLNINDGLGRIGVNTTNPAITLDVKPTNPNGTTPEGFIAPTLTRTQLITKSNSYQPIHAGALVYVTQINGIPTAKEANITKTGYYYYDGSAWQTSSSETSSSSPWFVQGGTTIATGNTQNIYQTGSVAIGANNAGTNKLLVQGDAKIGSLSTLDILGRVGINTTAPAGTLEIKPSNTGPSTPEGIIAPNLTRAQLINKSSRYLQGQVGALVYITDLSGTPTTKEANVTTPGYYYFDGTIWQPSAGKVPWLVQGSTTEATSNTQNIFQMGNVAIGANNAGSDKLYVSGNTRLGTNATNNTVINGSLFVPDLQDQLSSRALVVDVNTGKIGTSVGQPTRLMYVQKRLNQAIDGLELDNLNRGIPVVVRWSLSPVPGGSEGGSSFVGENSDIVSNNLDINLNQSDGEFTFGSDGSYEISGYVNYIPRSTGGALAALNIVVQHKRAGTSVWEPFTGARTMFQNSGYAQTCVFSPAVASFRRGDKIRLTVSKPAGEIGANHGGAGQAGLLRPGGLKYLASIKIASL